MVFPFKSLENFRIGLEPRHESFRLRVREFAEKFVSPMVGEMEERWEIPKSLLEKAAEEKFYGVGIPEKYGGVGEDVLQLAVMVEEFSRVYPAFGMALLVHHLFTTPILLHGTEQQKQHYVKPVASGLKYASHAVTEPAAGTDIMGIETSAHRREGEWIINGVKNFIAGAEYADYFIVLAKTSNNSKRPGLTFFIVERGDEGVRIGERNRVVGMRGFQPATIILEDVRIPDSRRVGEVGEGYRIALETYGRVRIGAAALAVGAAQALLEKSLRHALRRRAFGKPIISFQAISFPLADMLTELEAARLMLYWAATLTNMSEEAAAVAVSMAKLKASEVAEQAALKAIEIHGRLGVASGGVAERLLRDIEVMKIIEGTLEVQRIIISKYLSKAAERALP